MRRTRSTRRARAGLPPAVLRLLATIGGAVACWLIGVVLAAAAQAAEPSETEAAQGPATGESAPASSLLGAVAGAALGTVAEIVPGEQDKPADRAPAASAVRTEPSDILAEATEFLGHVADRGLPELAEALPEEPPGSTDPAPQAPTSPPPRRGTDDEPGSATTGRRHPGEVRRGIPAEDTAERRTEATRSAGAARHHPQRAPWPPETGPDATADAVSPPDPPAPEIPTPRTPTPTPPVLPEPVGIPPASGTGSAQPHGGGNGGHHSGVVAPEQLAAAPLVPITTAVDPAERDTDGDPALPCASPD